MNESLRKVHLKEILNCLDSKRVPLNDRERIAKKEEGGLYPYYGANGIVDYIDDYIFDLPILCVAEDGGKWGKNESSSYIVESKCWVNNHAHVFTAKDGTSLKYMMYYLNAADLTPLISGTTRGKLNKAKLEDLIVYLPPLPKQIEITNTLDKIYEVKEKRQETLSKLDTLIQSIFIHMFGNPINNERNWETYKLGDLGMDKYSIVDGPFGSSVNTKEDYVENGEIPVIRTKNVGINKFATNDLKFMTRAKFETVKRSQVLPGDIILTKVGTIGNVCIFPETFKEAVLSTTGSCRIRLNTQIVLQEYFIYYLLNYKDKMMQIAATGVQPFLNMQHIKNFSVPVPPLHMQTRFKEIYNKLKEQAKLLETSQYKIENLSEAIKHNVFTMVNV